MVATKQPKTRWTLAALLGLALLAGCGGKKTQRSDPGSSAEPDKVLYERAMEDIRRGRHTIARLDLQVLINAYPDSEYLAKAKLAIADSYYKEGGTAGLTQAVNEYKDFITFFPFLDESGYAQMQIALAHYRRMEKPDRDRTQARLAEQELQNFLLNYPNHPMLSQAEQRLREVQEVLAEGDFRIARFYFIKGSLRAAVARLQEVVDRYPLYSQADRALWMLGDAYERAERSDLASKHYASIVRDYPLSGLTVDARERLENLGVPVPQPDPGALARMQKEQELARERPGMLRRSLGLFKTGPDVSLAARTGQPNLQPPAEPTSPTQTLTPGAGNLSVGVASPGGTPATGGGSSAAEGTPPSAGGENPAKAAGAAKPPEVPVTTDKNKKKEEEKKKKDKESTSKKKKGLRKIIPW